MPDGALDESCYREAAASDILIMIIGGRYGAEKSGAGSKSKHDFFEQYDSITKKEFETAHSEDIPVFILIESNVHAEYQTFLKNRDNETIRYAHVDSINIFRLIENILTMPRNNPIYSFERSSQIESWLRDQWAGLFRELLKSRSQQKQLLALTSQVGELKAINDTLKRYLETMLASVSPSDSERLIASENKRVENAILADRLKVNEWFQFATHTLSAEYNIIKSIVLSPTDIETFISEIERLSGVEKSGKNKVLMITLDTKDAQNDYNKARAIFRMPEIDFSNVDENARKRVEAAESQSRKTTVKGRPIQKGSNSHE